jgi:hypothetical protein
VSYEALYRDFPFMLSLVEACIGFFGRIESWHPETSGRSVVCKPNVTIIQECHLRLLSTKSGGVVTLLPALLEPAEETRTCLGRPPPYFYKGATSPSTFVKPTFVKPMKEDTGSESGPICSLVGDPSGHVIDPRQS